MTAKTLWRQCLPTQKGGDTRFRQVRRTVTVAVGDFGLGSLGGAFRRDSTNLARSVMQVIRYYLADKESERAGWTYPSFRRDDRRGPAVEVQLDLDDAIWEAFSREADRQGVSTDQLVEHAVLYFAADRDSGRLAQRITKDLGGRVP